MFDKNTDYSITGNDSLFLKGIAICMLLWHHLFYNNPEYGQTVVFFAHLSKICVAFFLVLSGYGLSVKTESGKPGILRFYFLRLSKLYYNFWVIFIVSVLIGTLLFNRTLGDAYKTHVIVRFILDFIGMAGFQSYNQTWWFVKLIIVLYLLYPALFYVLNKSRIFIVFPFLILFVDFLDIFIIRDWLFAFCLGICYAIDRNRISGFFRRFNPVIVFLFLVMLFLVFVYCRMNIPLLGRVKLDGLLSILFILVVKQININDGFTNKLFSFLGIHSMNVFLIHSFLFYYFAPKLIYSSSYPVVVFLYLLSSSLLISVVVEYLKKSSGLNKAHKILIQKVDKKIFSTERKLQL